MFDHSLEHGLYDFLYIVGEVTDESYTLDKRSAGEVASLARARAKEIAKHQDHKFLQAQMRLIAPLDRKEVKLSKTIGRGGFSKVYEIQGFNIKDTRRSYDSHATEVRENLSLRATKQNKGKDDNVDFDAFSRYAIKHLHPRLINTPEKFAKAAVDIVSEAQILLGFDHPNIVKLRGLPASGPSAFKSGSSDGFFLVLDRLVDTLEDRVWLWRKQYKRHMRKHKEDVFLGKASRLLCLPQKSGMKDRFKSLKVRRLSIAYEISDAIAYIHGQRIICRDIKSTNIGFDYRGEAKMFDFGLSRHLPIGCPDDNFLMSNVGTRTYMAPEVSQKQAYNQSADIYSFGVVLWEMMSLSSPKARKQFERLKPCPCWPLELQQLVSSMLNFDSSARPKIKEVKQSLKETILEISDEEASSSLSKAEQKLKERIVIPNPDELSDHEEFFSETSSDTSFHYSTQSESA